MDKPGLTLRVDLSGGRAVGPGKIRLLEQIDKSGSITHAGRDLGLSYRRAWRLIEDLNNSFRHPVIEAEKGGVAGGGARLTPFGRKVVQLYQMIEAEALAATWKNRRNLQAVLNTTNRHGLRNSIRRPLSSPVARS